MNSLTILPPQPDQPSAFAIVRRVLVTVGGLLAFGVLGMLLAGTANAQTRAETAAPSSGAQPAPPQAPSGAASQFGRTIGALLAPATTATGTLVAPITEAVGTFAAPVTGPAGALVAPVAGAAAKAVAPALDPVVRAVDPAVAGVLRPVTGALAPVLRATEPVLGPVTGPVLRSAQPVLAPATAALGLGPAVTALGGDRTVPTGSVSLQSAPVPAQFVAPRATPGNVTDGAGTTRSDHTVDRPRLTLSTMDDVTPGQPAGTPGLPWLPMVPVASGSAGGASVGNGGTSGVGHAVTQGRASPGHLGLRLRLPENPTIASQDQYQFDRSHPS